tara:strand:+ start:2748 stop:3809 length:1062 start_codon:yes stop_codon:yes gene_type:complete
MTTIKYPMTKDYRKEWGIIDAAREIVQNCLDNKNQRSKFNLSADGTIVVTTENFKLPMQYFALGQSFKSENSIGGFGEGFKIALMILAREDCGAYAMNGTQIITPSFERCDTLELDLFTLTFEDNTLQEDDTTLIDNGGLTFIFHIPYDLIGELKEKINVFSDNILPIPNTVDILEEYPGQVFVNGLWVCKEQSFKYGYNFSPSKIRLGCDRQIASAHGMAWETSQVWADKVTSRNADDVLNMMTDGDLDVKDIQYFVSAAKAKFITEAFVRRFGHVTIKQMGSGLSYGMSVGGGLYSTLKKSGYTKVTNTWAENNTPHSIITRFLEANKSKIRRDVRLKFDDILEQAKGWKK